MPGWDPNSAYATAGYGYAAAPGMDYAGYGAPGMEGVPGMEAYPGQDALPPGMDSTAAPWGTVSDAYAPGMYNNYAPPGQ